MNRRQFLVSAAAAAGLRGGTTAANVNDSLLMMTLDEAERIRKAIPKASGRLAERVRSLRAAAAAQLQAGPWSVTTHRPPNSKFDLHDYYSEAPYFWPDPNNPGGPYIRHDGKRNPDRIANNRNDLGAMSTAVLALGAAAYFFDDNTCARHAAKVLRTWFIDPATRMNPNLEHAQAIPHINDGRATGLIDTVSLIHCSQGLLLLEKSGRLDPDIAGPLRQWFSQFTVWMTTSDKGLQESKSGNNHATWWTAQLAAYGTLTRDPGAIDKACRHYRDYLVPQEIQPNGSCPREEARTNSIGYSVFNADAFATLCRIAASSGTDLWTFKTPTGISYEKVVRYLEPYVLHPETWKGQQISPFKNDSTLFLGLAGEGLHASGLIAAYRTLPRADSPWVSLVDMAITV